MTPPCKICESRTEAAFALPVSKKTGHPIPDLPDDCIYYQCTRCKFCFSTHLDAADLTQLYDDTYWKDQDPDWGGRVTQTLRLVMLANDLVQRRPDEIEVLDFGCGMGTFVEACRRDLNLKAWGTDIILPRFGKDWFLPKVDRRFDIVVACEVMEHVATPVDTFRRMREMLKPGGALAFQTAQYDPPSTGRDWWYIGPDNGHISLYSRQALDHLFEALRGSKRQSWGGYPGIQAWRF